LSIDTPIEKNALTFLSGGSYIANRLLWLGISLGVLTFTYVRFRLTTPSTGSGRKEGSSKAISTTDPGWLKWGMAEPLSRARGTFSFATRLHQLKFITLKSFQALAKNRAGLLLLAFIAAVMAIALPGNLKVKGVPMLPGTDHVLNLFAAPLANPGKFWILIFLLTIFYAGELVWRERESGMSELSNATPVREWILFVSKFLSLGLILIVWLGFLLIAGVLAQMAIGGTHVELGLYLKVLFGFQLIECLLFAMLALVIHVIVNQKYIGHLVVVLIFGCIVYSSSLGLEHKLLIFGSSPAWSYTNMNGFGLTVGPWLWFKAYWMSWALLLAMAAILLWVRSREENLISRLQLARSRFTPAAAWITAVAAGSILISGSYIFYNTNVRNRYETSADISAGRARYEQLYGKYNGVPQPVLTDVDLNVEIYPERLELEMKGFYLLVNKQAVPIDSLFLALPAEIETEGVNFSRPVTRVLADHQSGFFIYALGKSLKQGDTLRVNFKLHHKTKGFTNGGAVALVAANGTNFRSSAYMPVVGYQPYRELDDAGLRKKYLLAPRPANASLYDAEARKYAPFTEDISFNAVAGTSEDQMVVAPGTLRKTWKQGNRRYFHYASDAPIRNEYFFFSAKYALHESDWVPPQDSGKPVVIQIYNDPGHAENIDRMMKSVKASLHYYSREFGPYPHRQLRFVSYPGYGIGNHASPINITAEEGFFLMNPKEDERGFDLVTAVVAHEVAHQWWGNQLRYAYIEGAGLLSESLAWYSAMGVLEEKYGPDHLKKLLNFLREEYETPRTKAAVPLLRGTDWYNNYRKGPLALYAMCRYIGKKKVNAALGSMLRKHSPGNGPLATSLDLYQELRTVTPDSLQYLLDDFFKTNTFWELEAKEAVVKQTKAGFWEVTLKVNSRKLSVSEQGLEKEIPLKDWIEIGIFAPTQKGDEEGKTLYLRKHLIDSKQQTITVTLPVKPALVGIDPDHLLIDWDVMDNFVKVKN
jgi:ABC-type transport system involved in multi-copper enzyme maturation permease subunit